MGMQAWKRIVPATLLCIAASRAVAADDGLGNASSPWPTPMVADPHVKPLPPAAASPLAAPKDLTAIEAGPATPVSAPTPATPVAAKKAPTKLGAPDGIVLTDYLHQIHEHEACDTPPCESGAPAACGAAAKSKYPTIIGTGFFQADALYFAQDANNRAAVGDAQDTTDFRRARMAFKGNVAENVSYMIEMDFAFPGRPSFMDVFLDIADLPIGHVRVGQWRQPFGMDALAGVRDLTFLERALPFAMVPFRQIGIGAYDTALEERATWAASAYRFPTDVFGDVTGDSGYGFATRGTALLFSDPDENQNTHVGFDYTINNPSTDTTRIRSAPEVGFNQLDYSTTFFSVPFFVDTGIVPTQTYQVVGVELAQSWGPLIFQSELYYGMVDQIGDPSVTFPGMYAQASYVLTGEHRNYNRQAGAFGRVIPDQNFGANGWGAWEVAARWSYLDLTDANVLGGELNDVTLGVNWYLNRYTKFQFNYIRAMLNSPGLGRSEASVVGVRAQLDF